MDYDWEVRILHSLQEGIKCVDFMVNMGHFLELGYHDFVDPLLGLRRLLLDDVAYVSFLRLVAC